MTAYRTVFAVSSGRGVRIDSAMVLAVSRTAGSVMWSAGSAETNPGSRTTRTPCSVTSCRSASAKASTPNPVAAYTALAADAVRPDVEGICTTAPLESSRWGCAAWTAYIGPSRLVPAMRVHSVVSAPRAGPPSIGPALLTRRSREPRASTVVAAVFSTDRRSVTSRSNSSVSPGASCAGDFSRSALRAPTATRAPACDRAGAVARPMPEDAPVTRAASPSRVLLTFSSRQEVTERS